jgi:epoxyqueuosine reductase QueG
MESYIKSLIISYVHSYPERQETATAWQEPIISFAAADDSLFNKLKEVVSPTHAMPTDFLTDAKSVITYFLPFDKKIAISNAGGRNASTEWAVAYIETNQLILDLNTFVHDKLQEHHYSATMIPGTHNFDEKKLISDWSHRHIAYIAGLGTFGLNNMLITEKGCCGRIGSIVTNLKLTPTLRTTRENCLYKYNGRCKKCITLCVTGALTETEFKRFTCHEMTLNNAEIFREIGLADVCGKCLVNIPCSFMNPTSKLP